jgi:hypothetical protein
VKQATDQRFVNFNMTSSNELLLEDLSLFRRRQIGASIVAAHDQLGDWLSLPASDFRSSDFRRARTSPGCQIAPQAVAVMFVGRPLRMCPLP